MADRSPSRGLLGVAGAVAWAAVLLLVYDQTGARVGLAAALWQNLGFFTDLGNLLVAIAFTGAAVGARWAGPRLLGLAVVAILVVGIGFWTVAGGAAVFGTQGWGDVLAHAAVPVLAPLAWLVAAPKAGLGWRDAVRWLAFPALYLLYAIARGLLTGGYPYPWMNGIRYGWAGVAEMVAIFLVLTLTVGLLVVGVARLTGRGTAR